MPEEYFEIAIINFDTMILHGRGVKKDADGNRIEFEIDQRLTDDQKSQVEKIEMKHRSSMDRLLSGFVDRS